MTKKINAIRDCRRAHKLSQQCARFRSKIAIVKAEWEEESVAGKALAQLQAALVTESVIIEIENKLKFERRYFY
jgi:phosphotransferase system HPr-like phosphotransfer protein